MTSRARTALAALALLPLLALAACAPEPEPEPVVETVPTPTAEPTVEPTALGSRVPADCETLLSAGGFADVTVTPQESFGPYLGGAFGQSGFQLCRGAGALGSVSAELSLIVSPDDMSAYLARSVEWARGAGYPADFAGTASYSNCSDRSDLPYCVVSVATTTYSFDLVITPTEPVGAGFTDSVIGVGTAFVDASSAWPEPAAPWQRPADAMVIGNDCIDDVAPVDAPIRAAIPWEVGEPTMTGSGDGQNGYYWLFSAVDATDCMWFGESAGGAVSVLLIPGAAWQHAAGVPLGGGAPIEIDGALAAVGPTSGSSEFSVHTYIDGSYLEVSVSAPLDSTVDSEQIARDVIAALVDAF